MVSDKWKSSPVGHLVPAFARLGWGLREAAERLVALGYRLTVDPETLPMEPVTAADIALISEDLDAEYPWLDPALPVPVGHLLAASAQVRWG
ncbi:MAG: hypothetical protein JXA67_18545, partial [Micromonosporaceae bacterium]|nr:hypothetical protein [Micromonosporaceae bacterium]